MLYTLGFVVNFNVCRRMDPREFDRAFAAMLFLICWPVTLFLAIAPDKEEEAKK